MPSKLQHEQHQHVETKVCTKCRRDLPLEAFSKNARTRDGRDFRCKDCRNLAAGEYRRTHRAVLVERANRWRQEHPEYHREKQRERYQRGRDLKGYSELYAKQNGRCAICGIPQESFHLDHDHSTGQTRGLLCQPCNMALGLFRDSVLILQAAVDYLEEAVVELEADDAL